MNDTPQEKDRQWTYRTVPQTQLPKGAVQPTTSPAVDHNAQQPTSISSLFSCEESTKGNTHPFLEIGRARRDLSRNLVDFCWVLQSLFRSKTRRQVESGGLGRHEEALTPCRIPRYVPSALRGVEIKNQSATTARMVPKGTEPDDLLPTRTKFKRKMTTKTALHVPPERVKFWSRSRVRQAMTYVGNKKATANPNLRNSFPPMEAYALAAT